MQPTYAAKAPLKSTDFPKLIARALLAARDAGKDPLPSAAVQVVEELGLPLWQEVRPPARSACRRRVWLAGSQLQESSAGR